ncbi:hypothetical protein D3C78_1466980 [compost metagenome]
MALLEALDGLFQATGRQQVLGHQQAFLGHLLAEHALRPGHVQLAGVAYREEQHGGRQRGAEEDQAVGEEELRIDGAQAQGTQGGLDAIGDPVEHEVLLETAPRAVRAACDEPTDHAVTDESLSHRPHAGCRHCSSPGAAV